MTRGVTNAMPAAQHFSFRNPAIDIHRIDNTIVGMVRKLKCKHTPTHTTRKITTFRNEKGCDPTKLNGV